MRESLTASDSLNSFDTAPRRVLSNFSIYPTQFNCWPAISSSSASFTALQRQKRDDNRATNLGAEKVWEGVDINELMNIFRWSIYYLLFVVVYLTRVVAVMVVVLASRSFSKRPASFLSGTQCNFVKI